MTEVVILTTSVISFHEGSSVNLFKKLKASVTARQAAERYGLKVNRSGMARCPFHDDENPSMKLDDRYYCFGCGATGDAVDLTARLLGLPPKEAALQLASDFGIEASENFKGQKVVVGKDTTTKKPQKRQEGIWAKYAGRVLTDYLWLLRDNEKKYTPHNMEDKDWHPLFCEALDRKIFIEYVLDELLAAGESDQEKLRRVFGKEVERVEKRLERYAA